jgi:hypothetical protein
MGTISRQEKFRQVS